MDASHGCRFKLANCGCSIETSPESGVRMRRRQTRAHGGTVMAVQCCDCSFKAGEWSLIRSWSAPAAAANGAYDLADAGTLVHMQKSTISSRLPDDLRHRFTPYTVLESSPQRLPQQLRQPPQAPPPAGCLPWQRTAGRRTGCPQAQRPHWPLPSQTSWTLPSCLLQGPLL